MQINPRRYAFESEKDRNLYITFEMVAIPNANTEIGGAFINVPHIRIQIPGKDEGIIYAPIKKKDLTDPGSRTAIYNKRFGGMVADYLNNVDKNVEITGTPIEVLGAYVTPADRENLRVTGVYTLEQLASLTDTQVKDLGSRGLKLREQAASAIKAQESALPFEELKAEIAKRDEKAQQDAKKVAELEAQIAALLAKVSAKAETTSKKDK